jgi:hypothetical protein
MKGPNDVANQLFEYLITKPVQPILFEKKRDDPNPFFSSTNILVEQDSNLELVLPEMIPLTRPIPSGTI